MPDLTAEQLSHFQGATTLCYCWHLQTRDGSQTICVTDHDRAVTFRGKSWQPGLVIEASVFRHTLSLSPEPLDLKGALEADGITADDLKAGVWDGAKVSVYRVDWQASDQGVWLWSGYITDIREEGDRFAIGLASIKSDLERTSGRVFSRRCDTVFGGSACGVDVGSAPQPECDKRFATCRDVFSNAENFRGFPHMPGNDAVISGPGEKRDGSSRGIER